MVLCDVLSKEVVGLTWLEVSAPLRSRRKHDRIIDVAVELHFVASYEFLCSVQT